MRLPAFVKKISPIGETMESMETGTALLSEETARRNRQLSVGTADTGLSLWEGDYSLSASGDTELRRARILAAMAARRTLTVEELKAMAVTVGGADSADVVEDFANWKVTLILVGKGRMPVRNLVLMETLERSKPAHLDIQVECRMELIAETTRYPAWTGAVLLETECQE